MQLCASAAASTQIIALRLHHAALASVFDHCLPIWRAGDQLCLLPPQDGTLDRWPAQAAERGLATLVERCSAVEREAGAVAARCADLREQHGQLAAACAAAESGRTKVLRGVLC